MRGCECPPPPEDPCGFVNCQMLILMSGVSGGKHGQPPCDPMDENNPQPGDSVSRNDSSTADDFTADFGKTQDIINPTRTTPVGVDRKFKLTVDYQNYCQDIGNHLHRIFGDSDTTWGSDTPSGDDDADVDDGTEQPDDGENPSPGFDVDTRVEEIQSAYMSMPGDPGVPEKRRSQKQVKLWARQKAIRYILDEYSFARVVDHEQSMNELRVYNPDTGVYEETNDEDISALIRDVLADQTTSEEVREITKAIRDRSKVMLEEVNAGVWEDNYILCTNGILNIDTWEFTGGFDDAEHYYFVSGINADWDPTVDMEPVWALIRSLVETHKEAMTLLNMAGDCLTPHYKRKWFGIIYGPSGSGKTQFTKMLTAVLRDGNVTNESLESITETRWASERLVSGVGMRANINPDISDKRITNVSPLKNLTGGDGMPHEGKGSDKFDKENTAKIIMGANMEPVIRDKKNDVKNRIIPIELPFEFVADPDPDATDPVEKQAVPGIVDDHLDTPDGRSAMLLLMAIGLEDWRSRSMDADGVALDESAEERFARYNAGADTMELLATTYWQNVRAYQEDGEPIHILNSEKYEMYKAMCEDVGVEPTDQRTFGTMVNRSTSIESLDYRQPSEGSDGKRHWGTKYLAPTEKGWKYAPGDVKERFAEQVSDDDVAPPLTDGIEVEGLSGHGDVDEGDKNDAVSDAERVMRVMPGAEATDGGGASVGSLAGETGLSPDATRDALGSLMVDGEVVLKGDEYHTAAATDGGEDVE